MFIADFKSKIYDSFGVEHCEINFFSFYKHIIPLVLKRLNSHKTAVPQMLFQYFPSRTSKCVGLPSSFLSASIQRAVHSITF